MWTSLDNLAVIDDEDLSADRIVESRWAITKVTRPGHETTQCTSSADSVLASSADVGSSRMRIGESLKKALAIERRCFSPPERVAPRSPIERVVTLRARARMNLSAFALIAARHDVLAVCIDRP